MNSSAIRSIEHFDKGQSLTNAIEYIYVICSIYIYIYIWLRGYHYIYIKVIYNM